MNCETCQDLMVEYSLDELSDRDRSAVDAHLASGCSRCAAELARILAGWETLAETLPRESVRPEVAARLEARLSGEAGASQVASRAPVDDRHADPDARSRGADAASPSERAASLASPVNQPAGLAGRWHTVNLAASIAMLIIGTVVLATSIDRVFELRAAHAEQQLSASQMRKLQEQLSAAQRQFAPPRLHYAALQHMKSNSGTRGVIAWDHLSMQWHVCIFDLPPAPHGSGYQLWMVATGGEFISLGPLSIDAQETGYGVVDVPGDVAVDAAAITLESADNPPPQPSGNVVLRGPMR